MPHGRPDSAGVLLALVEAEAPLVNVEAHLRYGARVPHSELRDQLVVSWMSLRAGDPSSSLWVHGSPARVYLACYIIDQRSTAASGGAERALPSLRHGCRRR